MQRKGSISWSFSESRPQLPHAALFIRDAARLVVPTRASIPPRMSGELPDRSSVADDAERRAAGDQWASWWRDIVKRAFQQVGLDPPARLDSGMDDRLSLQSVVRELSDEAYRWGNGPNHKADHGPGNFDGAMLGEMVHAVAAEFGSDHAEVSGRVVVLDVQGVWWHLASPGGALCSVAAANDASTARLVVTEVFRSSLAPPR